MARVIADGRVRPVAPIVGAPFRFRSLSGGGDPKSRHGHRQRVIDQVISITLPYLPSLQLDRQAAEPSIVVEY